MTYTKLLSLQIIKNAICTSYGREILLNRLKISKITLTDSTN